jgi:hypothetical protein
LIKRRHNTACVLSSGSSLMGADKTAPQKTVTPIREVVVTQCYLSGAQAA